MSKGMNMCQILQGSSGHRPVLGTLPTISLLRGFILSLCVLPVFSSPCRREQGREGWKYPCKMELRWLQKLPFQRILEILYRTRGSGLCYQSENGDPLWNTY